MSRRRYDTDGVALIDDPTPELPLALPGLIEPHALLGRLHWHVGFPDAQVPRAGQGARSDEFDAIELADIEHEVVAAAASGAAESGAAPEAGAAPLPTVAPPPAPVRRREQRPPAGRDPEVAAAPGAPRLRPPPAPHTRIGRPAAATPKSPDEVDSLMTEILAAEGTPSVRRTSSDWWAEIFDATYLRLLPDSFYVRTLREVEFLVAALEARPGARLLDCACGYGRHVVELAARGFEVVGLDSARGLLERAFSESDRRGLAPELLLGDMRELAFEDAFDGAYCWHTSFGYFDDATNYAVLEGLARALKPGGRLVVEQVNRDHVVQRCPRRLWWERDEMVIMEDITFDHPSSRLLVERQIADQAKPPWEQRISIRLYSPHELAAMMTCVDLDVVGITGDIAHPGAYLGAENRNVIVTARKRG